MLVYEMTPEELPTGWDVAQQCLRFLEQLKTEADGGRRNILEQLLAAEIMKLKMLQGSVPLGKGFRYCSPQY